MERMINVSKWCFNYDSGEYENIERDGFSIDRESMFIIGMTANIVKRKKNVSGKKIMSIVGK